jgi:hypothetical protein
VAKRSRLTVDSERSGAPLRTANLNLSNRRMRTRMSGGVARE